MGPLRQLPAAGQSDYVLVSISISKKRITPTHDSRHNSHTQNNIAAFSRQEHGASKRAKHYYSLLSTSFDFDFSFRLFRCSFYSPLPHPSSISIPINTPLYPLVVFFSYRKRSRVNLPRVHQESSVKKKTVKIKLDFSLLHKVCPFNFFYKLNFVLLDQLNISKLFLIFSLIRFRDFCVARLCLNSHQLFILSSKQSFSISVL